MNEHEVQKSVKRSQKTIEQADQLLEKAGLMLANEQKMYAAAGFTPESLQAFMRASLPPEVVRHADALAQEERRHSINQKDQTSKPAISRTNRKLPTNFI